MSETLHDLVMFAKQQEVLCRMFLFKAYNERIYEIRKQTNTAEKGMLKAVYGEKIRIKSDISEACNPHGIAVHTIRQSGCFGKFSKLPECNCLREGRDEGCVSHGGNRTGGRREGNRASWPKQLTCFAKISACLRVWVFYLCAENDVMLSGDCLLYTSPSPRDLSTSRMPSSA